MLILALASPESARRDRVGSKAGNLADLAKAGLPVPDGFVVTVEGFGRFCEANRLGEGSPPDAVERARIPDEVAAAIRSAASPLGESAVAVRSSGVAEDLPDASFAGQYETILDVRGPDAVLEAVRTCWASAFAPRVIAYRASMGKPGPPRMAVLVQKLVHADAAGVAFTANPVTGDRREVVVSAVRGLGERLVSGQASADEWVVREGRAECRRSVEGAVSEAEVRAVADLARRVAVHYGVPQDVEWAIEGGRLYLLQARPITALPEPVEWNTPVPGVWLRNFRLGEWLGEPLTPLFETWLVERLDDRLYGNLKRALHMPTPEPYHVVVNGWYFATANFLPKNVLHMLGLGIRYFLPGFLLRPRKMSMLTTSKAYWGIAWFEREWREAVRPRYRSAVAEAERRIGTAGSQELLEIVDGLADAAGDSFYSLAAVAGSAWKPEYVLAAFYRKHLAPRIGGSHQALLQGLGGAPDGIASSGVVSLDWSRPSLEQTGSAPRERGDKHPRRTAEAERVRAETATRETLSSAPRRLRRFERLLDRAQHAARVREEQTAEFTLAWPAMRSALLRIGDDLASQGRLASPEDVFFLRKEELFAVVRRPDVDQELRERIPDRRRDGQRQRRLVPPLQLGALPRMAGRLLDRFERTLAGSEAAREGLVTGMPASPGRATGPVRVIRSVEEFDRLRSGEVLVAPMTNPAWTPLFALAAAVVTDTGSLMAHASLVAREYGIPAVVGTGDGTARLRDGMIVTVDGGRGVVEAARGT